MEIALKISLFCVCIHFLFVDGMLLNKIKLFLLDILYFEVESEQYGMEIHLETKLNNKIKTFDFRWMIKPLFDCLICMSSIHGVLWSWLYYHINEIDLVQSVMMVMAFNVIFDSVIYFLREKI